MIWKIASSLPSVRTRLSSSIRIVLFLNVCCVSSPTRGVWGGGSPGINVMGYVTIATQGDAVDFGDLVTATRVHVCSSNAHGGFG